MNYIYRFNPFNDYWELLEYIPELERVKVIGRYKCRLDGEKSFKNMLNAMNKCLLH